MRRRVVGIAGNTSLKQWKGGRPWRASTAVALLITVAGEGAVRGGYQGVRIGEASNLGPYSEGGAIGSREEGDKTTGGEEIGISDTACAQMLNDILGHESGWVDPQEHGRAWRRYQEKALGLDITQRWGQGGASRGSGDRRRGHRGKSSERGAGQ